MSCHSERSEESDELLSVAKNTSTIAFQILRDAQDDNMIGEVHFDTPSWLTSIYKKEEPALTGKLFLLLDFN